MTTEEIAATLTRVTSMQDQLDLRLAELKAKVALATQPPQPPRSISPAHTYRALPENRLSVADELRRWLRCWPPKRD